MKMKNQRWIRVVCDSGLWALCRMLAKYAVGQPFCALPRICKDSPFFPSPYTSPAEAAWVGGFESPSSVVPLCSWSAKYTALASIQFLKTKPYHQPISPQALLSFVSSCTAGLPASFAAVLIPTSDPAIFCAHSMVYSLFNSLVSAFLVSCVLANVKDSGGAWRQGSELPLRNLFIS